MADNRAPNLPQVYIEIDKVIDRDFLNEVSPLAQNLSMALNELWDEAWNVVVAKLFKLNTDFTSCNLAFRHHWMWHNNYRGYSIVLWKDYNCGGVFVTYDSTGGGVSASHSGYSQALSSYI